MIVVDSAKSLNAFCLLLSSRTVIIGNLKRKCTIYMDAGLKIKSFFAEVLRNVADDADPNQVNKELEPSSMLHP